MHKNKKIQTSTQRLSFSEKRRKSLKLKSIKKINLSNSNNNNKKSKRQEEKEENQVINLQNGGIIGKLYKKTNQTEWAAQNRAIKERLNSNYEVKQIIKRYNFNKDKTKYGFTNEYINELTELLYSGKKDYSKERLKLAKYRFHHLSKNRRKDIKNYTNSYNLNLNNLDNTNINNDKLNEKRMIPKLIFSTKNRIFNKNDLNCNLFLNTLNNIKNNQFIKNTNNYNNKYVKVLNKENNLNILNNRTLTDNRNNAYNNTKIDNNYSFPNNLYANNNDTNNIYLKINEEESINNISNNNNIELNSSIKSLDNGSSLNNSKNLKNIKYKFKTNKQKLNNSPYKRKAYENERDIFFEKEKEEDEFLVSGDKDKYENYLKNKFDFFEDLEDKQTLYIYEIKKRNMTIFKNKLVEMKNNHKPVLNYLSKISRDKDHKLGKQKEYKIHDLFKEKYTRAQINNFILNKKSKKVLNNLKYVLK